MQAPHEHSSHSLLIPEATKAGDLLDGSMAFLKMPACSFKTQILDQLGRCAAIILDELAREGARRHFHARGKTFNSQILIQMLDEPGMQGGELGLNAACIRVRLGCECQAELRLPSWAMQENDKIPRDCKA